MQRPTIRSAQALWFLGHRDGHVQYILDSNKDAKIFMNKTITAKFVVSPQFTHSPKFRGVGGTQSVSSFRTPLLAN